MRSERFRTLWAHQDVRNRVTYHAERTSESGERRLLLAHLAERPAPEEGGMHRQVRRRL